MHLLDSTPVCAVKGDCSEEESNLSILAGHTPHLLVCYSHIYLILSPLRMHESWIEMVFHRFEHSRLIISLYSHSQIQGTHGLRYGYQRLWRRSPISFHAAGLRSVVDHPRS
jgi:hypothetical protein